MLSIVGHPCLVSRGDLAGDALQAQVANQADKRINLRYLILHAGRVSDDLLKRGKAAFTTVL